MITWFDEPYTVRLTDGFDYLMQGVYLVPPSSASFANTIAILIDENGHYILKNITEVQTDWRRRKDGTWGGSKVDDE